LHNTATREEWCQHFKNLYSFLKGFPEMIEMMFDEWQKSVHVYREEVAQRDKEIKNATDLEEREVAMGEGELKSVVTLTKEESKRKRRRDVEDLVGGTEDETKQIEEVDDEVVRDMRGTHTHQSYPVYTLPRFGSRGLP
jgi:hypothetical protein